MIWTARRRTTTIAALSLTAATLGLANLIKYGHVSWQFLADRKDALAAANSAVSILVLIVGGMLAYFKFFRGRTFSVRADIELSANVIPAPDGERLHVLNLSVRNVGTVAMWDPRARLLVYVNADWNEPQVVDRWEEKLHAQDTRRRSAVLDSGETGYFVTHTLFPPSVWAVTYIAEVTCDSGDVWQRVTTVSNEPSKDEAPSNRAMERPGYAGRSSPHR
jgi:hypothetical protein